MYSKKYRIPAAILLAIYLAVTIFRDMKYYMEYVLYDSVWYLALLFFVEFAVDILLCAALFSGNLITVAIGLEALVRVLYLVRSFTFLNALSLCAYVFLLVITILLTEQTIFRANISKIREKVKPVAILPAVILLCISVYLGLLPFDFDSLAVFEWWKSGISLHRSFSIYYVRLCC